jgi:hypothetical protein
MTSAAELSCLTRRGSGIELLLGYVDLDGGTHLGTRPGVLIAET